MGGFVFLIKVVEILVTSKYLLLFYGIFFSEKSPIHDFSYFLASYPKHVRLLLHNFFFYFEFSFITTLFSNFLLFFWNNFFFIILTMWHFLLYWLTSVISFPGTIRHVMLVTHYWQQYFLVSKTTHFFFFISIPILTFSSFSHITIVCFRSLV